MTNPPRTALVLAGGGLLGAMYELGALTALDAALTDFSATDFDVFVGTSAGALVCACLANGMAPATMLRSVAQRTGGVAPLAFADLFRLDTPGLLLRGLNLPQALLRALGGAVRASGSVSLLDLLEHIGGALPGGVYDGRALERYVAAALSASGMTNDFQALRRELLIVATDLDSAERAVFGAPPLDSVPISRAVAASSAVPLLYRPVPINGREYVDGGVRGNASLDLAVERGARLIVCINPLVPLRSGRRVSARGAAAVANQTFRAFVQAQVHYHVKHLRATHPEVDIVLIEPDGADELLFDAPPMGYAGRLQVARHAAERVAAWLMAEAAALRPLFARHGITLGVGTP